MARADLQFHSTLWAIIEEVSDDVLGITDKAFDKIERIEYYRSYAHFILDPEPQLVLLRATPVDLAATLMVIWAPYDDHATNGTTLVRDTDYFIDANTGLVTIRGASNLVNALIPRIGGLPIFTDNPRGFKVTYTGGYDVWELGIGAEADPTDDTDVVQVPSGLMRVVAREVVERYREMHRKDSPGKGIDGELFKRRLKPYILKDRV